MGIGDWGLGIVDWAQSPIPNFYFNNYVTSYKQKLKTIY